MHVKGTLYKTDPSLKMSNRYWRQCVVCAGQGSSFLAKTAGKQGIQLYVLAYLRNFKRAGMSISWGMPGVTMSSTTSSLPKAR